MNKTFTKHCITVFAFLSLIIVQDAAAQKKVYLGVKVGGNLSKTTVSEYAFKNPARFGLNPNSEVGFIAHLPINDSLSIQPEILLVKKGYQAFGVFNNPDGSTNRKSYEEWENTFIEVPVLAKLAVGNKKVKFFFAAGPSFSFWAKSSYNRDSTGGNLVKESYKVEHKFRSTVPKVLDSVEAENGQKIAATAIYDSITVRARQEVSAVFSTGFQYKLKNRSMLIFDIRYIYGLTLPYEFLEDKRALNIDTSNPPRKQPIMHQERNRRFSFSVSYLFSFKD